MFRITDIAEQLGRRFPPFSERRLHNRARAAWEAARKGNKVPRIGDLDWQRMEKISEHAFLLTLRDSMSPLVVRAGDVIAEEAGLTSLPVCLDDVPKSSLLGQFGLRWQEPVLKSEPMTSEYEFITEYGYQISCRGVLLPLSTDGETIDQVCGVINWKSQQATRP